MKVQDLIDSALRLFGEFEVGEGGNDEDRADGLAVLNQMLAEWNTQQFTVYTIQNKQFPLTGSKGTYTMGTGGDFNSARPVKIQRANVIQSNGLSDELDLIGTDEWAAIEEKSLSGLRPLKLYNDNDYPLAKLNLWPKPSGTPTLDLYVWEEIGTLALDDDLDFPPGYEKAIRYNLALDLAPEYGREVSASVAAQAAQLKAELAGLNVSNLAATTPLRPAPAAPQQVAA